MLDKAIEVMKNELECVKRAEECDRHCEDCDLLMDADEIIEVYDWMIKKLQKEKFLEKKKEIERRKEEYKKIHGKSWWEEQEN